MTHGSLFSGIGGFDLAAEWMDWENVFQVEYDEWCQKILTKNFPNVKKYRDIKDFKGYPVDVISGGFPCQPFSHAGKRQGEADNRYLWPEMLRVIREAKPTFVVGENVAGLVSMENGKTLDGIFADLENEGYEVESFIIPAASVGAWHRRDRIWILAYTSNGSDRANGGQEGKEKSISGECGETGCSRVFSGAGEDVSNTNKTNGNTEGTGQQGSILGQGETQFRGGNTRGGEGFRDYWKTEPDVGRVAHGIPNRVDRLKGLGNAIVPQVAYEIFKAIDKL